MECHRAAERAIHPNDRHLKADHPDATFDIAAEGSTTGIAALIDGAEWMLPKAVNVV